MNSLKVPGIALVSVTLFAQVGLADDRWSVEAEIETGVEAVTSAQDPENEVSEVFVSVDLEAEFALSERTTLFSALSLESITDAEKDRAFQDMGIYFSELGLSFDLEPVTLSIGKISPAFGSAWDTAPGYFGADFAEDYELEEMIGLSAALEMGQGALTLSAFYPDDTRFSDSWGTRRGRNSTSNGGVGNTGKLNNLALQYDHDFDATTLHFGLRHLNRGEEDHDENGVVLGMTHVFGDEVEIIAELAHFNGWEGSPDDASIATIGARFERGPINWSAALSQRHVSGAPVDRLIALGMDVTFENGMTLSAGVARTVEEDEDTDEIAVSLTVPFGD